jgi:hypothetical protein
VIYCISTLYSKGFSDLSSILPYVSPQKDIFAVLMCYFFEILPDGINLSDVQVYCFKTYVDHYVAQTSPLLHNLSD